MMSEMMSIYEKQANSNCFLQTVNLLRFASMVRIRPPPPQKDQFERIGLFVRLGKRQGIRKAALGKCPVDTCNRRGFAAAKRIRLILPES